MKIYSYNGKSNLCGERIRAARKKARMTQLELAAKLQLEGVDLTRDAISKIEGGYRFVADYELLAFARVLQISVLWLLNADE